MTKQSVYLEPINRGSLNNTHSPMNNVNGQINFQDKRADFNRMKELIHFLDNSPLIQCKPLSDSKLNICGENHRESHPRRSKEKQYTEEKTGGVYKTEGEFKTRKYFFKGNDKLGDPLMLRCEMLLAILKEKSLPLIIDVFALGKMPNAFSHEYVDCDVAWIKYNPYLKKDLEEIALSLWKALTEEPEEARQAAKAINVYSALKTLIDQLPSHTIAKTGASTVAPEIRRIITLFANEVIDEDDIKPEATLTALRSSAMQKAAQTNAERVIGKQKGVWKVGDAHIPQIASEKKVDTYELLTKEEFNDDFMPWYTSNP